MKELLAGIADYAAKGIYAVIHWYGTATTQDLYDAKYKQGAILRAIKILEKDGYIERPSKGVYRDVNRHGQRYDRSGRRYDETTADGGLTAVGGGTEQKCRSGRKAQTTAQCGTTAPGCGSTALGGGTGKSVNVVNVEESINESWAPRISSTLEIESFLDELPLKDLERWDRFQQECFLMEGLLKLPGLSRDVIIRIVLAEDLLGFAIPTDMLDKWRLGAISAERSGNVPQAWVAFANSVKRFYQKADVKWTKCRPNRLREIDNKLADLKKQKPGKLITGQELLDQQTDMSRVEKIGDTLSTFKIKTPEGEQSAADFISFKQCDDMERYVKGKATQAKKGKQKHG
jgi:hypothetical protein